MADNDPLNMRPGQAKQKSLAELTDEINRLSHYEMCRLHRFAPSGHPYFIRGTDACQLFEAKFKELGGMTPEISKSLGWND